MTPLEINEFILNAAINKNSVIKTYRALRKLHPNQKIDYVDLEWKYYQFYHGNQDLTIERSPDNSSQLTFFDLPIDVLENVVTKLNLPTCMALRKVSPDLRNLVDSTEVHCERLYVGFATKTLKFCFDNLMLTYSRAEEQWMIADVGTFLKNQKLKIDSLGFFVLQSEASTWCLEFLKSLDFKLNVRSIVIPEAEEIILPVLQCLKPQRLEHIHFNDCDLTKRRFDEIVETEHFKIAKQFHCFSIFRGFPMEKMMHFKTIEIVEFQLSDENLIAVRDNLLKSPHLELFSVTFVRYNDDGRMESGEQKLERIMSQDPAYDSRTRRFSIPNSRDHFQLEFETDDRNVKIDNLKIEKIFEN